MWKPGRLTKVLTLVAIAWSAAFAEDPPKGSAMRIDFTKSVGYMDYTGSENLPDGAAQAMVNVDLYTKHNLSRRRGFSSARGINLIQNSKWGDSFLRIFDSTSAIKTYVYRIGDVFKGSRISDGQTYDFGALNGRVDGLRWGNFMYVVSQSSPGAKIYQSAADGALSVAFTTGIPSGGCSQVHLDRLMVACSSKTPLDIFYSESASPEFFDPDNVIFGRGSRDSAITGLGPTLLGSMPIYTRNTTSVLVGNQFPTDDTDGNLSVRLISDNIGCLDHRTAKNLTPTKQYFLSTGPNDSKPGIYLFNGVTVEEVTKGAYKFFEFMSSSQSISRPVAYVNDDKYCVFFSSNGKTILNNFRVCVDLQNRVEISTGITAVGDVDVKDGNVYAITDGGKPDNAAAPNTGYPFFPNISLLEDNTYDQVDNVSFSTKAIQFYYKTKDFPIGRDSNRAYKAERAYIQFENTQGTITVRANFDYNRSSQTWVINTSTKYQYGSVITDMYSPGRIVNQLKFEQNEFNYINFELFGLDSSTQSINYIDLYAFPKQL